MTIRSEAYFRDVKFYIENSDDKFGRLVVKHQFPNREKPYVEDLGKRLGTFSVEGYVVGEDHLTQKDRLKDAAEATGPGLLVHPHYGTIKVICDDLQVRHSSKEKRITRFQFTFTEAGEEIVLAQTKNTPEVVTDKVNVSLESIKNEFKPKYKYTSLLYSGTQSVIESLKQASYEIQKAKILFATETQFINDISTILGLVQSIAFDAIQLATDFIDLITFGILDQDQNENGVPDLRESLKEIQKLYTFDPVLPAPSSTSDAFAALIQQTAVVVSAKLLSEIGFTSAEEAFLYRDQVITKLDEIIESEIDDDLFLSLSELRVAIIEDIDARAAELSRLTQFTPKETSPVLAIVNRLYGNIDNEQDVLDRNNIFHPGFAKGGDPLNVAING